MTDLDILLKMTDELDDRLQKSGRTAALLASLAFKITHTSDFDTLADLLELTPDELAEYQLAVSDGGELCKLLSRNSIKIG